MNKCYVIFIILLILIVIDLFISNSQKEAVILHKDSYMNKIFEYQEKIDYSKVENAKKLNVCNEDIKNGYIGNECKKWLDSVVYYSNN